MQYNACNTNVSNDFHMYIDALADMLDSMEPVDVRKRKFFHDSYKWIKHISQLETDNKDGDKKGTVIKSAIDLLCRHMDLFRDLLYSDCKLWHDILQRLSLKTTIGVHGQRALKRFYRVTGQILTNENSEENDYNDTLVVRHYVRLELKKFNEIYRTFFLNFLIVIKKRTFRELKISKNLMDKVVFSSINFSYIIYDVFFVLVFFAVF
jgi:hypothetical protein